MSDAPGTAPAADLRTTQKELTMTWTAYHNRGETLRSVMATAATRQDGVLPMDVPGVAETFHGELDLLGALQLRWHTRLSGNIEQQLTAQPMDLEEAVAVAWKLTAEELPGVRKILDHYRDHPVDDEMARAMAAATAKEHYFLAVMAGRSALGDKSAAWVGARIEQHARDLYRDVTTLVPEGDREGTPRRPGLLERLRAVVAA
jgi:hypothetical protein